MRKEDLQDAIGQVEDDLLEHAEKMRENHEDIPVIGGNRRRKRFRIGGGSLAACLCLVILGGVALKAGILGGGGSSSSEEVASVDQAAVSEEVSGDNAVSETDLPDDAGSDIGAGQLLVQAASYPEQVDCPDMLTEDGEVQYDNYDAWASQMKERNDAAEAVKKGMDSFAGKTINTFLAGQKDNTVFAPANVYMTLGLLGACANGETKEQILSVMGMQDDSALAETMENLRRASYVDDGATTSLTANSVWMSDTFSYKEEKLTELADLFGASSYSGEMGSEGYNEILRQWLNDNTNGLLENQVKNVKLDASTALALASTIYYKAQWNSKFDASRTEKDTFHGLSGDTTTEFMNGGTMTKVIKGAHYTAFQLDFASDGSMWIVLPDEDADVDTVLKDQSVQEILAGNGADLDGDTVSLTLKMPKFDVGGSTDLVEELENLGITDAFDAEKADFSGILTDADAFVSEILHGARVKADEDGVEAAAFSMVAMVGSAKTDHMEITVDRPFLFSIVNGGEIPLFTGVVNNL